MINRRNFIKASLLGSTPILCSGFYPAGTFSLFKKNKLIIFQTHFQSNPQTEGWKMIKNDEAPVLWHHSKDEHFISAKLGEWNSPSIDITPYHYYKITYIGKGAADGFINVMFLDENNEPCITDVYDLLFLSENWESNTVCFRAFALAKRCRIQLISVSEEISIDQIIVEEVNQQEVSIWQNNLLHTMPPIVYQMEAGKHYFPNITKNIKAGKNIRIVMLGDSTINDTGNSIYETCLQREFPDSEIKVVNSIRGSTGCPWFQKENRVKDFVLKFNPDMVIIGGISNGFDEESIRSVIKQIRAVQNPDILVLSDSITPENILYKRFFEGNPGMQQEQGEEIMGQYQGKLIAMTKAENVNFLDMRKLWNEYVANSGKPLKWFMRDEIHANSRGKQVVGQYLVSYLKSCILPE